MSEFILVMPFVLYSTVSQQRGAKGIHNSLWPHPNLFSPFSCSTLTDSYTPLKLKALPFANSDPAATRHLEAHKAAALGY